MSGSPVKRSHSTNSSISHFSLQDPPKIEPVEIDKNLPRRVLSLSPRGRRRREAAVHQDHPPHSQSEPRNSEPQTILINDWIKMKIEVPKIYLGILYANMLASLFTWLLLAGFMVLPVTFASLRSSRALNGIGKAGKAVFGAVQNIPFLWLAGVCFVCGVIGLSWIWWENRKNYIWLTDRVFLPVLLNSLIGLFATLINVYTTQGGHWSVTAVITAVVTAFITLVSAVISYMLYELWTKPAWKEHWAMNRSYVASR